MAFHNFNGSPDDAINGSLRCVAGELGSSEYSGDERESRSGEEQPYCGIGDNPIYLLEHLATFTVNKDSGIVFPADGMRRLLQLEKTTGIWSQKMQLCLDGQWVLIMDYETGNVIERFPASLIHEPTAFTSTDTMELYNNILVFIVSGSNNSRSEMHIFQSQNISAVNLVEDLKSLRNGNMMPNKRDGSLKQRQHRLSGQIGNNTRSNDINKALSTLVVNQHQQDIEDITRPQSNMNQYDLHVRIAVAGNIHTTSGNNSDTDSEHGGLNDDTCSTGSDKYERDVTILNHCFDDIEKFIARLQHAAAATRELERRRHNRKTKKQIPGEGLLKLRTRPPHEEEFLDIFAKFKLSFNLLAKLKAHIHDPNAPELVHFLFTPLALIVEACSDTYYESQLPANTINPLLTREAINLLINCVTSKETELWRSLGEAWTIPREQWKSVVGPYHPVFMDGWTPDFFMTDGLEMSSPPASINEALRDAQTELSVSRYAEHVSDGRTNAANRNISSILQTDQTNALKTKYPCHYERGDDLLVTVDPANNDIKKQNEKAINPIDRSGIFSPKLRINDVHAISSGVQQLHLRDMKDTINISNTASIYCGHNNDESMLEEWLDGLQAVGAKIVLVTYPRMANNDKELCVSRGEYLEILDDSRKWWKARNIRGQVAHVPHTIVKPFNYIDDSTSNLIYGQQEASHQQYNYTQCKPGNTTHNNNNRSRRSQDTADWIHNKHLD